MSDELAPLIEKITNLDRAQKQRIFDAIASDVLVHELENHFGISVQIICEAIIRGGDLTQRGIRGIIAETVFSMKVVPWVSSWRDVTPKGDLPYDVLLTNGRREVRIQVKMQRKRDGVPLMRAKEKRGAKRFYVVEVQRTRSGNKDGKNTRPYKYDEFDLLAVCMQPSTGDWTKFLFAPAEILLPKPKLGDLPLRGGDNIIETLQCVPPYPGTIDSDWTPSLNDALDRII